jgi:insertion element IS1 protein InsB
MSQRVLGWALGDRNTRTARALGQTLPRGAQLTYTTDHWPYYRKTFPTVQQREGKAHTHTIESLNSRIRHYLARLRRRTHCYSKSKRNLATSIVFSPKRKCAAELVACPTPARKNAAVLSSITSIPN